MTNPNSFLDSLIDDNSLDELLALAQESHSIRLDGLYCYHTGKLIGQFNHNELREALFEEGDLDSESMIDALIVRIVNSMRPSPALNRPDMGTIREMVQRRPVDALAYLLNRFLHPLTLKRDYDESFSALRGRIETYYWCATLDNSEIATFTHWLLALDSQFGLSRLEPPKGIEHPESISEAVVLIEKYAIARLLEVKDSYVRGEASNSLARGAYIRHALDNPEFATRKAEAAWKAKNKPARAATQKKVSKIQERTNKFLGLLDEVINRASENAATSAPAAPRKGRVIKPGALFANRKPKEV